MAAMDAVYPKTQIPHSVKSPLDWGEIEEVKGFFSTRDTLVTT